MYGQMLCAEFRRFTLITLPPPRGLLRKYRDQDDEVKYMLNSMLVNKDQMPGLKIFVS